MSSEPESEDEEFSVGEPSEQWYDYQGAPTGTDIECEGWRQE
ncbi:MAG: urocanate hydratase, partial [Halobacteriales archaeon]